MLEFANNIDRSSELYNLNGKPITSIVLSTKKYSGGDTIDGELWANEVRRAVADNDIKSINKLAKYTYAQYLTKKAHAAHPGGHRKRADFSGYIDGVSQMEKDPASRYKRLRKILDKLSTGTDTSGWQYGGNRGKLTGFFVRSKHKVLPYADWVNRAEAASQVGDNKTLAELLALSQYYGVTNDAKNTYNDIIQDSNIAENTPMSEAALRVLYANHPKLPQILEAAKEHKRLLELEDRTSVDRTKALGKLFRSTEAIEREKAKAVGDLDRLAEDAFGAYYDAGVSSHDKVKLAELHQRYKEAQATYDAAAKPFDDRLSDAKKLEVATLKPYNDSLESIWGKLNDIQSRKL
jgi:hypothetical protein